MKFGAHVSIAGGIFNAPQNGKDSTCDVVQIFTRNQMQWKVPHLPEEDIARFKDEEKRTGVTAVCVHASYLINLGGFDKQKLSMSRENFIIEMQRTDALDIPYLVIHPGSHTGNGEEKGIRRIVESLNYVLDQYPDCQHKILLETTAGQGDNLGYTFEQLAEMISKVEAQGKIGICLDTCHVFAAGYELRTKKGYQKTFAQADEIVGLEHVGVIHINDSKRKFGSRVDRHEHIGDGELGLEAFSQLVNEPRFIDVPMIIETPGGYKKDKENLRNLRNLKDA